MSEIGLTGIAALEAEMRDRLKAKDAEIERLRKRIAEMSALARSVRERVDVLIAMEIDEAGREALAAHL